MVLDTSKVGGTKSLSKVTKLIHKPVYLNEFSRFEALKMVVWFGLGRVELVTFRLLLFRHILE